jgi:chromosome segregation ATPase
MQHIKVLSPKDTNFSGYISDTQERNFNYNYNTGEGDISIKSNNPSAGKYSYQSAASNALKALQDKIKQFQIENEELRKRLINEEDRIEKEREEFQTKFIKEVNKTREIECAYRNEMESIKEENLLLNNVVNEQKNEINLLKTNIQVLENEKDRHLEQNIMVLIIKGRIKRTLNKK